jgi:hypothetical protein
MRQCPVGNGNARRTVVLPASPLSFSFDSSSRDSPSRELVRMGEIGRVWKNEALGFE